MCIWCIINIGGVTMKFAKYEKAREWNTGLQFTKIHEEFGEFEQEVENKNKQGILAEGFDVMQAIFTYFDVLGYSTGEIKAHLSLHEQKLQGRHENGTLKIKEWLKLEV